MTLSWPVSKPAMPHPSGSDAAVRVGKLLNHSVAPFGGCELRAEVLAKLPVQRNELRILVGPARAASTSATTSANFPSALRTTSVTALRLRISLLRPELARLRSLFFVTFGLCRSPFTNGVKHNQSARTLS